MTPYNHDSTQRALMRLAFVNPNLAHEYDVTTPFERALAGSQSAQCYLAIELARRGHEVGLFNGTKTRRTEFGVRCGPLEDLQGFEQPAAILVLNSPGYARSLRERLGAEVPIFCWEHNPWSPDDHYNLHVRSPLSPHDHVLCVSEWQRNQYIAVGKVPPERLFVLRNAVSPAFEAGLPLSGSILERKAWPPVLAFTSTPFKGLKAALLFFKELRRLHGSATLNIFSSFEMYPPNNEHRLDRSWYEVYESCRTLPGVNYLGNVSQGNLARTLTSTLVLFFPSVLQETSSICVMEAMAAGCIVISSELGGLPEVMSGFGRQIPLQDGRVLQGQRFIEEALKLFELFDRREPALEAELRRQVEFIRKNYVWSSRAVEFEQLIQSLGT